MSSISKEELKWRAESDANTLAMYQEIISDKARMNAAVKAARQQASDLQKRADAMKRASGKSSSKRK